MTLLKTTAFATVMTAAALMAGSAFAQSQPAPPAAPAWSPPPGASPYSTGGGGFESYNQFQRVVWQQHLTDMADHLPTQAQWARAREAATLINNNQCDDAHKMALGARDRKLAARIVEVCLTPKS
jgi:ABC-type sugar transport system substrate-binding protein